MLITQNAVPYLLYIETYRHGSGGKLHWQNCADHKAVRNCVDIYLSELKQADAVRGIRTSVVNVQRVLVGTLEAINDAEDADEELQP